MCIRASSLKVKQKDGRIPSDAEELHEGISLRCRNHLGNHSRKGPIGLQGHDHRQSRHRGDEPQLPGLAYDQLHTHNTYASSNATPLASEVPTHNACADADNMSS